MQGSQEKQLSQARGFAEAVGVVPRPGAGDLSAVEGGDRAPGQDGPRRAERYQHIAVDYSVQFFIGQRLGDADLGETNTASAKIVQNLNTGIKTTGKGNDGNTHKSKFLKSCFNFLGGGMETLQLPSWLL